MGVAESLLVAGIVCIVAAVVGGGVKMLGAEMPVLGSFARQALLFAVGLAFLLGSFAVMQPKPVPPASAAASQSQSPQPPGVASGLASSPAVSQPSHGPAPVAPPPAASLGVSCAASSALDCLPRSSAPVVFRDPAAAGLTAARNLRDNLSTTEAAALAAREGASGHAARLCGIVASDDSSALGKHTAALRLTTPGSVDGQASAPCLAMAQSFL
jgi:hypothetical protein